MSSLRTPLCDLLGIEYPILSVGFGRSAGPELVASVSNAGGFGVLGAGGWGAEFITPVIARTRELTDRPFGVNVLLPELEDPNLSEEDEQFLRDAVSAAAEAAVGAIVLFWGPAEPFVTLARAHGVNTLIQVGSVQEAETAAAVGVDAVIAQGFEAGGHVRGTTSIWELLPGTIEAVHPLPVLASGGIGDGAGVARALALGAQGVSLGTRFVASEEAFVHPEFKHRVVEGGSADLVYADLYTVGWPGVAHHRTLRNTLFEEWDRAGRPPEGGRAGEGISIGTRLGLSGEREEVFRYASVMVTPDFEVDIDYAPLWAGESIDVVKDIKPAAEIVADLVRDAEAALAG
jgi:NAD(P)H-dependent flavin oxidoreductase YrpB (nitropropane dioxygenase family)